MGCQVDGCTRKHYGRGYCRMHYRRWRGHGDPLVTARSANGTPLAERLARYSRRDENGCLVWTGPLHDKTGYARIGVNGRMVYVHVAAWELVNGAVPPGLVLRHTCDTAACFDVAHLLTGTQKDNVADMFARGRCDRRGERNNRARLTWPDVRRIRAEHQSGRSAKSLAADYGVSESQIGNIVHCRQWKEAA